MDSTLAPSLCFFRCARISATTPKVFIQPHNTRNLQLLGSDPYADPLRRVATERALELGSRAASMQRGRCARGLTILNGREACRLVQFV